MELKAQQKLAGHILRLLKVTYIDFPIGRTNKGNLTFRFSDNGDFEMMLDSVPLSTKDSLQDENNIELKRMFEKYWFSNMQTKTYSGYEGAITLNALSTGTEKKHLEGARKGRPKGSKNKAKTDDKESHQKTA